MLDSYIAELHRLGRLYQQGDYSADYRERIQLERALFCTARHVAIRGLGYALQGFSVQARSEVEEQLRDLADDRVGHCLRVAFELASVAATLSSGDSYRRKDIGAPVIGGRSEAVRVLGSRLRRHAERCAALIGDLT